MPDEEKHELQGDVPQRKISVNSPYQKPTSDPPPQPAVGFPELGQAGEPAPATATWPQRLKLAGLGILISTNQLDASALPPPVRQATSSKAAAVVTPERDESRDRIVKAICAAQSEAPTAAEKERTKSLLDQTYRDVADDLRNPQKVADKVTDELVSELVRFLLEHVAPETLGVVLIALHLKRKKDSPVLVRTGNDLDNVNRFYLSGAPVTIQNIHVHLHMDEERAVAALLTGRYECEVTDFPPDSVTFHGGATWRPSNRWQL
jgi:hypothetical protein